MVLEGHAGALDFEEASFDVGVVSLVLCTVPDQSLAIEACEGFAFRPARYLPPVAHILGAARRP